MSLTNLQFSDFKKIAKLLTRKESLLRIVGAIDKELSSFDSGGNGNGSSAATTVRRGRGRKRVGRGKMKEQIVAILKAGGKKGVHVKDIVKQTGAKDPNVRVWFYATGKKIKNIKQVAPATYAWVD